MRDESQTTNKRRLPSRHSALVGVCALVLALTALGCGSGSSSDSQSTVASTTSSTSSTQDGTASDASDASSGGGAAKSSGGDAVAIADFDYDPKTITVNAGDKVEFTNNDTAAHTATADDSSFDTGTLNKGDTASVTLKKPGTYTYYCRFHAFMHGTIEVK